jgi:hypothetical protein
MKPTLRPGLKHSFSYTVPIGKTVPAVTVGAECIEVRGPRAKFAVRPHDGIDEIGRHSRAVHHGLGPVQQIRRCQGREGQRQG